MQGRQKQKILGGARQGLVEPRDIVLNLVTHVVTKELPEGLVPYQIIGGGPGPPHQNYWGDQCPLHVQPPRFYRPWLVSNGV